MAKDKHTGCLVGRASSRCSAWRAISKLHWAPSNQHQHQHPSPMPGIWNNTSCELQSLNGARKLDCLVLVISGFLGQHDWQHYLFYLSDTEEIQKKIICCSNMPSFLLLLAKLYDFNLSQQVTYTIIGHDAAWTSCVPCPLNILAYTYAFVSSNSDLRIKQMHEQYKHWVLRYATL